jgi:hypothetical protein
MNQDLCHLGGDALDRQWTQLFAQNSTNHSDRLMATPGVMALQKNA